MKKTLFSVILIASVLIFSAYTYKSNTSSVSNPLYQGFHGLVTYNGTGMASQTVTISKGSFSTTKTTDATGHYVALDNELDGAGTYTASVSWCVGNFWFHGSNSGYYTGTSGTIDITVAKQSGCNY
ncbi:MAG: hypothetical protein WC209_18310 [Ignavibacteriaceae bacterium]|jgi:hypothetical protein